MSTVYPDQFQRFLASSPSSLGDADRERAGTESLVPARWPRYVLDPGSPGFRRDLAHEAELTREAFTEARRRAERRERGLIIAIALCGIAILIITLAMSALAVSA